MFLLRFSSTSRLLVQPTLRCAAAGSGWLLITGAIYVLNGVSDIEGDRANNSVRPLASGALRLRHAVGASATAAAAGVLLCWWDSPLCGALAAGMALLGLAYSLGPTFKQHALSAAGTIGLGAGLTYAAGWSVRGDITLWNSVFAAGLSCWIAAASSTKDFSDIAGDELAGRRTLAVALGLQRAARIVAGISAVAVSAVVMASIWARIGMLPVLLLGVGTAVLALACNKAVRAHERSGRRVPYRVYMATQYALNGLMLVSTT